VSAQCVAPGGPAAAGTCQEPRVVHWGEHNGTTQGAPARESGSCAGQGGERVYVLRLDTASTVCVDTFQSNFDTAIYVRRDQCASPQAELICNDDMRGVQSELEFRAEAGVDYYIFVDGYQAPGDFVLNLRQGGCHDLPGR